MRKNPDLTGDAIFPKQMSRGHQSGRLFDCNCVQTTTYLTIRHLRTIKTGHDLLRNLASLRMREFRVSGRSVFWWVDVGIVIVRDEFSERQNP
jgi:hypothetical protein